VADLTLFTEAGTMHGGAKPGDRRRCTAEPTGEGGGGNDNSVWLDLGGR
jgi:hypothetical protein